MIVTNKEAFAWQVNINFDFEIGEDLYTYQSTWVGGVEEEFEILDEYGNELDDQDDLHEDVSEWLFTAPNSEYKHETNYDLLINNITTD